MKKLKNILLSILFVFAMVIVGVLPKVVSVAEATNFNISYNDFKSDLNVVLTEICAKKDRIAGSDGEKQFASYISNYLLSNTAFVGKNNSSTQSGIQNFKFISTLTGVYNNSQNVIFEKKSSKTTDKKVVFTCSYDVPAKYDSESESYVSLSTDSLNVSSGNIASMFMFAKSFSTIDFDFNLEFVFFGASENADVGADFYLDGVSKEEQDNILCVVNIDKIAVGKNVYFYIDEIDTKFTKFVSKTSSGMIKKLDEVNVNKTEYVSNDLNLTYSHVGLASQNTKFMARGITTINLFAGDYDNGFVAGLNEFEGKNNVSFTSNDNLDYVNQNYGENAVSDNLYKTYSAIETLLTSKNFVNEATASAGSTSWFYKIFANEKLALYLTAVAFFVMIIIAMFIYYKLTIKAYNANFEVEFLSSVVKIVDQVGEENKPNDDITKVVGQVIANDIKKDKTIKSKRKKK